MSRKRALFAIESFSILILSYMFFQLMPINFIKTNFNSLLRSFSVDFKTANKMNSVCRRSAVYPADRFLVPDDKVLWKEPYPSYEPPSYSAPYLNKVPWADPDINDEKFKPEWNAEDGGIDRRSFDNELIIPYNIKDGYPMNPKGRTGLKGRGRLGRWGPNHAGDAIVTRWKTKKGVKEVSSSGKPVLQFIAILRKDSGQWAIPGGFVDPKEASSAAVLRELFEEAIDMKKLSNEVQENLRSFFKSGKQVYKGYVDDPRNTDNAWIETTAINFHDDSGSNTEKIVLDARDDAADVTWVDIVPDMVIYPPHYAIIDCLKKLHGIAL